MRSLLLLLLWGLRLGAALDERRRHGDDAWRCFADAVQHLLPAFAVVLLFAVQRAHELFELLHLLHRREKVVFLAARLLDHFHEERLFGLLRQLHLRHDHLLALHLLLQEELLLLRRLGRRQLLLLLLLHQEDFLLPLLGRRLLALHLLHEEQEVAA